MRDQLQPYLGEYRTFLGTFVRMGLAETGKKRKRLRKLRVLFRNVIDVETGTVIADHLWLPRSPFENELGYIPAYYRVRFTALVCQYTKRNKKRDFSMKYIHNISLIRPLEHEKENLS
jgi:hypothetical protein